MIFEASAGFPTMDSFSGLNTNLFRLLIVSGITCKSGTDLGDDIMPKEMGWLRYEGKPESAELLPSVVAPYAT